MKAIDKLLFNTLIKKQGVNLPGVGSLDVVYEPAQMIEDNIYPPRWRVVFSRQEKENLPSLVKLIEVFGKMDADTAAALYSKWLEQIGRDDGNMIMEGVGEVKNGNFKPGKELSTAFVPERFKSIRVKRKSHMGIWFGIVMLAVLVSVGFYCYNAGFIGDWMAFKKNSMTGQPNVTAQEKKSAEMLTDNISESITGKVGVNDGIENTGDEALQPSTSSSVSGGQQPVMSDGHGRYCLSVGVFTVPENADKTIAKDPLNIGEENYKRMDWRGRVLVYVSSSDDRSEINRLYAKYISVYSDIAIFDLGE